ncbi:hypothetical protein KIL84_003762 [Mauremys mutica]|uniref:Uncharacterized protein n=1 Tax=Mauremys mutica TaxID=74926 RepID=A0A9D3WQ22_9SAUR|nr:hypothetical protein KIL84_003762 [Mauremys mutica]
MVHACRWTANIHATTPPIYRHTNRWQTCMQTSHACERCVDVIMCILSMTGVTCLQITDIPAKRLQTCMHLDSPLSCLHIHTANMHAEADSIVTVRTLWDLEM